MVPFDMTARRRPNGLGEAQRGAQQFDLVQEQLRVAIRAEVGPALVASGEDHRAHRVPRLLEPAHDLQVARLVAHDPEVPELLLQTLCDGHDLLRGLQEAAPLLEPLERPRGLVRVQQVGVSEGFHFSLRDSWVPANASEFESVPREQLHVAVRPLHVPVRALLGRRHSDWLDWLWGRSCLRRFSLRRLLALGRRWPRCRHTFRGFGLVLAAGRAASSLGRWRLGHSSCRRRRRRLWGRLHRRWSRLRWGLRWLRGLGHGVDIFLHFL